MTIIVEDGTGLSTAVSYTSVAEADAYFSVRLITLWANMVTAEKEACLIRATDHMLQKTRSRWKGFRLLTTQRLDWPRTGVIVDEYTEIAEDAIPEEVKNACAELALRASISTLSEDGSRGVTQETIGPVTVKYDQYSQTSPSYTQVFDWIKPFLNSSGSGAMVKLFRC